MKITEKRPLDSRLEQKILLFYVFCLDPNPFFFLFVFVIIYLFIF